MTQVQTIVARERAPGGWDVKIQTTGVFTDDTPHVRSVFVPAAAVTGKTAEEVKQAVYDAASDDPIRQLVGQTIAQPTQTREVLTRALRPLYADWQMWKDLNAEVIARNIGGAALQTAVAAQVESAWSDIAAVATVWRAANPGTPGFPRPNGVAS